MTSLPLPCTISTRCNPSDSTSKYIKTSLRQYLQLHQDIPQTVPPTTSRHPSNSTSNYIKTSLKQYLQALQDIPQTVPPTTSRHPSDSTSNYIKTSLKQYLQAHHVLTHSVKSDMRFRYAGFSTELMIRFLKM